MVVGERERREKGNNKEGEREKERERIGFVNNNGILSGSATRNPAQKSRRIDSSF